MAYSARPACSRCALKLPMQPLRMYSPCDLLHFFHVTNSGLGRMKLERGVERGGGGRCVVSFSG